MAFAAYTELLGARSAREWPAARQQAFVVMEITLPTSEAFQVRRLLARAAHGGVLRCTPLAHDQRVKLEIRVEAEKCRHLMDELMLAVPVGEIGRVRSWTEHLNTYQDARGY